MLVLFGHSLFVVRPWTIFTALSLAGCTANQQVYVPLEQIETDFIFIVTSEPSHQNIRIQNNLSRKPANYMQEPLSEFSLTTENQTAYLLGFNKEDILAQRPNLATSRLEDIQLFLRDEAPRPSADTLVKDLPSVSQTLVYDPESKKLITPLPEDYSGLLNRLVLSTPIDLDYCRNEQQETLANYPRLNPESCTANYRKLFYLDQDRFVAIGSRQAHLYNTQETMDCETLSMDTGTSTSVSSRVIFPGSENHISVGKVPLRSEATPKYLMAAVSKVFATEESKNFNRPTSFLIEEVIIGPGGFERRNKTYEVDSGAIMSKIAQRCASPGLTRPPKLIDIIIDYKNTVTILLENGTLLILERGQDAFRHEAICDYTQYATDWLLDFSHLNVRPDIQNNYFIGTDSTEGFAYLFGIDELIDNPVKAYVESGRAMELAFSTFDEYGPSPQFMAVANGHSENDGFKDNQGLILEQDSNQSGFKEWDAKYPVRISECSFDDHLKILVQLVVDEKAVYVLPKCNAILRVRRQDRCSQIIKTPNHEYFSPDLDILKTILIHGDKLIAAGDNGSLLYIDLPGIDP